MKILCAFGRYAYGDPARGEGYEYTNFLPALRALGHEVEIFDTFDRSLHADFGALNAAFVEMVLRYRPDVIFTVLMHYEIWLETLDLVRGFTPAVIVNWGTDDSWKYRQFSRHLARHVDIHATTDLDAYGVAQITGLNNVHLTQWAAAGVRLQPPLPSESCKYDVSFVGAAYGRRLDWIRGLAERGITVACFGHGWPGGAVAADEVFEIYRQSRISLNFADPSWQFGAAGARRQIKARNFEVPGAGGLLLTEGADGLDCYFEIGREVDVFTSIESLAARIRHYLANPVWRDAVAAAGYARVLAEHRYEARLSELLTVARATTATRSAEEKGWRLSVTQLEPVLASHHMNGMLRLLRLFLVGPCRFLFGSTRGARAARRVLYELSWRLCGAATFRAGGLPGRLFYRES